MAKNGSKLHYAGDHDCAVVNETCSHMSKSLKGEMHDIKIHIL